MLSYRNYEWDQLSGSALSAQRAAVDLPMTTPGVAFTDAFKTYGGCVNVVAAWVMR